MLAMFSALKASPAETGHGSETPVTPTGDFVKSSSGFGMEKAKQSVVVAGMDITTWQVVEINVPAGPLGILLDGSCAQAALLDDFAPVARDGTPGAVEASGTVPHGSVLVGMDSVDFLLEPRKNLADIGTILRESAHLKRRLRFRVPPLDRKKLKASEESDTSMLLQGPTSSSTELVSSNDTDKAKAAGERSSWTWSGVRASTKLAAPASCVASPESDPTPLPPPIPEAPVPDVASPTVRPLVKPTGRAPSFVRVTGMEDRTPSCGPFVPRDCDKVVAVDVPAGSLGLNLDGTVSDRAVVVGFVALPDGSRGTLERNGSVGAGAELVEINGEDVSQAPLAFIRERLSATSGTQRRLSFRLPQPPKSAASLKLQSATRAISAASKMRVNHESSGPVFLEDADLRRRLELKLIMSFDRKELKFKECWFVVNTAWMNRWVLFVGKGGPEPGPISNDELLQPGWEAHLSDDTPGCADVVRSGLQLAKDYRCVAPLVWSLLVALHGSGEAPTLARYALDIESEAASQLEINQVLHEATPQAVGLAAKLREKCQVLQTPSQ
ncbi:hypothetical protein BBJ28_00002894 [Nothophytophthora sp. Chile5]|nr:hypothetical protein BBJ28_00002894 [Nothophytophthora sp. Chile5]